MQQPSPQPMDQDAENTRFSDDDDSRLFESCDPEMVSNILCIKRNDTTVNILEVVNNINLDDAASRRLGVIIGQNTQLEELRLLGCGIDVEAFCAGLQSNRSIEKFRLHGIDLQSRFLLYGIDLQSSETMSSLAPFLARNPRINKITLKGCRLGQASIDILANVLSNSAGNNLESISLNCNPIGDIDLNGFIEELSESRRLRILCLSRCGIGQRACASFAALLDNQQSNLTNLNLQRNAIDEKCTITLAASLANNKNLRVLGLEGNDRIASEGWSAMLQLVCERSSINNLINSNHVLRSLGYLTKKKFIQAIGVDDGNLLQSSLELNKGDDKLLVARRKIIWGHARGDFNLGEVSIAWGAMPRVVAWIGNDAHESDSRMIQYHDPPLQEPEIGIARIGGIYRILRSMPDLCNRERNENVIAQEP